MVTLSEAATNIQQFESDSLTSQLATLERKFVNTTATGSQSLCNSLDIDVPLLESAFVLKKVAGQINVIVHSVGILISLPHILQEGEVVESLSLGAGNTGKSFDLETNLRVAEFKFIQWKGGSEAIRQNSIFKDFYYLAESSTHKLRELYVIGLKYPSKFFEGGRSLNSIMSKNRKLADDFEGQYGSRFQKVSEYFNYRKSQVSIVDISALIPNIEEIF